MPGRDPHPDSLPDNDNDDRSDIEQAVESRSDEADSVEGIPGEEPLGVGGEGGADGVVKNQEDAGQ